MRDSDFSIEIKSPSNSNLHLIIDNKSAGFTHQPSLEGIENTIKFLKRSLDILQGFRGGMLSQQYWDKEMDKFIKERENRGVHQ